MEESQIINGRLVKAFSCYFNNVPQEMREYQKKVFEKFGMHINQGLGIGHHNQFLNSVMKKESDVYLIFDIDAIPLQPGLFEYMVNQLADDNSIIGNEQAANHVDYRQVYAGVVAFGVTKVAYEKLGRPTFVGTAGRCDTGGEFTIAAKKLGMNVKLIPILTSLNKKWRCGENKWFGNGTIYGLETVDPLATNTKMIYHQFETPDVMQQIQFISRCKHILSK